MTKQATITGTELYELISETKSARMVGLAILGRMMCEEDAEGDSASNNFALATFEQALDWSVGIEAVSIAQAYAGTGKRPKALRFSINRGKVSVVHAASGRAVWAS